MAQIVFIIFFFVALVQGYTTFTTNCTRPFTAVNFVSSTNTRGTIDILWSSLFTIIACTYTVQHLNVPEQREGRDQGRLGSIKWAFKGFWASAKWMVATVLAPEILLGKSCGDFVAVSEVTGQLQAFAVEDGVQWTKTHSFLANMGGFVIRSYVSKRPPIQIDAGIQTDPASSQGDEISSESEILNRQQPGDHDQTNSKAQEAGANSILGNTGPTLGTDVEKPEPQSTGPYHLVAADILALRKAGILKALPNVTEDDINDKSKSDSFVRVITVVQIAWMVVQTIVRSFKNLAISQLELSVLAFASCAFIIYGFNWKKPKGVKVPYTLLEYPQGIPPSVLKTFDERKNNFLLSGIREIFSFVFNSFKEGKTSNTAGRPIPNDSSLESSSGGVNTIGLIFGSIVFGAIHIAAWNFEFPTRVESIIWKASSIYCTFAGVGIFALAVFATIVGENSWIGLLVVMIFAGGAILFPIAYVAARVFMIVEIFRTLLFLPQSAYVATWASNVPHIS